MTAADATTVFGLRGLVLADAIYRFTFERRNFVITRTENDNEYLLAMDLRYVVNCFALIEVDAAGAYAGHQGQSSTLDDDEITTLARMAGWKILTYRARGPSNPAQTPRAGLSAGDGVGSRRLPTHFIPSA